MLHGWFLAGTMLMAEITGFGRMYEAPDGSPVRKPQKKGDIPLFRRSEKEECPLFFAPFFCPTKFTQGLRKR